MSERVEPIDEARGLYSVEARGLYSVGRSEWNVTHRFSVTEFLTGGGDDRQDHDWCRGLDRDNAGERFEFDPGFALIFGAYAAAMNDYVRRALKFEADAPFV